MYSVCVHVYMYVLGILFGILIVCSANTELQYKHRTNEQRSIYDGLMIRAKEKDKDVKLVHI